MAALSSTSFILQPSPLNRGVKDVPEKEIRGGDFSDFLSDGQRTEGGWGGGGGRLKRGSQRDVVNWDDL
jgi:hypothetical protein